ITTIDHIAEDVHRDHLLISTKHIEVGSEGMDSAILNAKGFGGNNASATVLAPHIVQRMLARHHGSRAMTAWQQRNEAVAAAAAAYDAAASAGEWRIIYRFDHNVMGGGDIDLSRSGISVPGFGQPIDLEADSPYRDWL
ncbi:MAG: beta-ketoacyl synthase, partial [Spongiibacteraceae bacterium]|nr:beta-ketoacyl synthase [Spongiibacteraceae bacterium]